MSAVRKMVSVCTSVLPLLMEGSVNVKMAGL